VSFSIPGSVEDVGKFVGNLIFSGFSANIFLESDSAQCELTVCQDRTIPKFPAQLVQPQRREDDQENDGKKGKIGLTFPAFKDCSGP